MPEIKQIEPTKVAFLTMRGSYSLIPQGYGRLYGWLADRGMTPIGMPRAVYLTDPERVPEIEAEWELQVPVVEGVEESEPDGNGLGVKRVAPMKAASALHKGPYETLGETYGPLMEWIAEQGLTVSGPVSEIYYSDPSQVGPENNLTEVLVPVDS